MTFFRRLARNEEGFTLIELLIVIAILGILAGIAVPRITGTRTEAAQAALESTAGTIKNTMEMYYASYGEYPTLAALAADSTDLSPLKTALQTKPTGETSSIGFDVSASDVFLKTASVSAANSYTITLVNSSAQEYTITSTP